MEIERRNEGNQVPESLDGVLNELQLLTLRNLEAFGWMLAYIRRPLFQETVPVLLHPDKGILGTLEGDGALNAQPDITFR